jgi:excisionase family DNA binding protein/PAS domain S-box-containing protein
LIKGTWLTVQDVAAALAEPVATVRRWVRDGNLPVLELGGSRTVYRIRRSDLEHFVRGHYPDGSMDHLFSDASHSSVEAQGLAGSEVNLAEIDSRLDSPREFVDRMPAVTFREATLLAETSSFFSREIESLLGYSPEDLLQTPLSWREHIHPEDRAAVEDELARTDATAEPFLMEYRMVRRDGQIIWIRVDAVLTDRSGTDEAVWEGVIADVTALHDLQADLLVHQRQQSAISELGQLALEHQTLTDVLQEAARLAASGLDSPCVRVFEALPGGAVLAVRAHACDAAAGSDLMRLDRIDALTLYAYETRAMVKSEDLGVETRFDGSELIDGANVRSGLATVIPGRVRPFGVLTALFHDSREFGQDDVTFLQSLASIVAQVARQSEGSWYTVEEVAEFLQVTEETVRRWIRRGELPALNLGGPRAGYRVYPTDLERFIHDRLRSK